MRGHMNVFSCLTKASCRIGGIVNVIHKTLKTSVEDLALVRLWRKQTSKSIRYLTEAGFARNGIRLCPTSCGLTSSIDLVRLLRYIITCASASCESEQLMIESCVLVFWLLPRRSGPYIGPLYPSRHDLQLPSSNSA